MDFSKLQDLVLESAHNNHTVSSLPSVFLDAVIPGYRIFSQIIFRFLGIDIGLAVSGCVVMYALLFGARRLFVRSEKLFSSYFTSSVLIEDDDDLFNQTMEWVAEQPITKVLRSLKAVSKNNSNNRSIFDQSAAAEPKEQDVVDQPGIFNYEKWASTIPPRYEPDFGRTRFWFKGRLFFFTRSRREAKVMKPWSRGDDEFIILSCVGRSSAPIKELLRHIKNWTVTKDSRMTTVYRPASRPNRQTYHWARQCVRPSRPLSTVSLDQEQKAVIVSDINEYLQPSCARWYAARGIPYRRGYLFHGAPGTGKTSLSFALAGVFGLSIYCMSITEAGLTDSDLSKLFSELPRRCIVLLEDIDSAGLRRPDDAADSKKKKKSSKGSDAEKSDAPGAVPEDPTEPTTTSESKITLSGLLNAVDGVASHEGRVLIMTTNCPGKLDPALVRPGRVDLQVEFTLATRDQIRDIFARMYSSERDNIPRLPTVPLPSKIPPSKGSSQDKSSVDDPDTENLALLFRKPDHDKIDEEKVKEMANHFADLLPSETLSPAEIQGFLLMRKRDPKKALDDVEKWFEVLLEKRKEGRPLEMEAV
ncbi:P-loop containing nucleoside triphosphate hydrolase protein [Sporormia fimetaria CBS 119925]|uniref:P-loop containing nucleoside triphosphate hydrolase protein n=1 Tax=Sporormia fimetaria CBS 119925 TaxID=1340428 RepID=A0A6A6V5Z6_9PLEO|nr:P-loop containing nucleoside triphosphate hydrolase protein [Sporormia fimetaria CBS 119925]